MEPTTFTAREQPAQEARSYLDVPATELPLALARLHWALAVGSPAQLVVRQGERAVVVGAGFEVEEETVEHRWIRTWVRRARTLPDTVGSGMRLLVCGLNPSVYAADAGVGFARPGNRFWPAALAAGLVTKDRDPLDALVTHGIGMTDLVKRATPAAAELTALEYRQGVERVERLVRWLRPTAVCFVGLAGWRAAVDRRARAGPQPDGFGGVPAYVMPSTSGLNAHTQLDGAIEHLRAAAALTRVSE